LDDCYCWAEFFEVTEVVLLGYFCRGQKDVHTCIIFDIKWVGQHFETSSKTNPVTLVLRTSADQADGGGGGR
jgi:hypothetical protein